VRTGLSVLPPDLPELQDLNWLSSSDMPLLDRIASIPPGTFEGTPALTQLRLDGNSIDTVEDGVFEGMEGLRMLNLCKMRQEGERTITFSMDGGFLTATDLVGVLVNTAMRAQVYQVCRRFSDLAANSFSPSSPPFPTDVPKNKLVEGMGTEMHRICDEY
jgi:hypothetical protein